MDRLSPNDDPAQERSVRRQGTVGSLILMAIFAVGAFTLDRLRHDPHRLLWWCIAAAQTLTALTEHIAKTVIMASAREWAKMWHFDPKSVDHTSRAYDRTTAEKVWLAITAVLYVVTLTVSIIGIAFSFTSQAADAAVGAAALDALLYVVAFAAIVGSAGNLGRPVMPGGAQTPEDFLKWLVALLASGVEICTVSWWPCAGGFVLAVGVVAVREVRCRAAEKPQIMR